MEHILIYTAGSSLGNPGLSAIGVQVVDATGKILKEVSEKIGNATNDLAEYQAVLRGLQTAEQYFVNKTKDISFEIKLVSELVKKQLNNESQIVEPGLVPYFIAIHNMRVLNFPNLTLTQISQELNSEADRLVNEALDA